MTNNIETFFSCRRLKESRDRIKFGFAGPPASDCEPLAAFLQLYFAYLVRHINEMEFMVSFSAVKELSKPAALTARVTGKIEHDGYTLQ